MATEEGWVSVEEVATHLRVAKESVYRWVEAKGLPAHRVGRLLRFSLSEIDEWVRNSGQAESSSDLPRLRPRRAEKVSEQKEESDE